MYSSRILTLALRSRGVSATPAPGAGDREPRPARADAAGDAASLPARSRLGALEEARYVSSLRWFRVWSRACANSSVALIVVD